MVKTTNINNKGKTRKNKKLVYGNGNDCAFPFKFKGKVYDNECVKGDTGDWCATSKTKNNYTDTWAYCEKHNPKLKTPEQLAISPRSSSSRKSSTEIAQPYINTFVAINAPKPQTPRKSSSSNSKEEDTDLKITFENIDIILAKTTYKTYNVYKSVTLGHKKGKTNGKQWLVMNPGKGSEFTFTTIDEAFNVYKNDREYYNKRYEIVNFEGFDDSEIKNKIPELNFSPVDIKKCNNEKAGFGLGDDFKDIDKKKIIQLSNGNCYDIDELVGYLISQKGKNIDPINSANGKITPIWNNQEELLEIRNFPGIEPDIKKEFQTVMDKTLAMLRMPPYIRILNTEKGIEFMRRLIITGKICSEDYTKDDLFQNAAAEIARTREFFIENFTKEERDKISNITTVNGIRLESTLLKDTGDMCIHGIGFRFCSFYFSAFVNTRKTYKDLGEECKIKLFPGIVEIRDDVFIFCHGSEGSNYKKKAIFPLTGFIYDTKNGTNTDGGVGRLVKIRGKTNVYIESVFGFNYGFAERQIPFYKQNFHKITGNDPTFLLNQFADRPQGEKPKKKLTPVIDCKHKKVNILKINILKIIKLLNDRKGKDKYKNVKENGRMIEIKGSENPKVNGLYIELEALKNNKESYIKIIPFSDFYYFSYNKHYNDWRLQGAMDYKKNNNNCFMHYWENVKEKVMENEGYFKENIMYILYNNKWNKDDNIKIVKYNIDGNIDYDIDKYFELKYGIEDKKDSNSSSKHNSDSPPDKPVIQPNEPVVQVELTNEEIADLKERNELPYGGVLQEAMKAQDRNAIKILMKARAIKPKKKSSKKSQNKTPKKKSPKKEHKKTDNQHQDLLPGKYKKLDHIEHIKEISDTYIGNIPQEKEHIQMNKKTQSKSRSSSSNRSKKSSSSSKIEKDNIGKSFFGLKENGKIDPLQLNSQFVLTQNATQGGFEENEIKFEFIMSVTMIKNRYKIFIQKTKTKNGKAIKLKDTTVWWNPKKGDEGNPSKILQDKINAGYELSWRI
jgi:hypothetical protein